MVNDSQQDQLGKFNRNLPDEVTNEARRQALVNEFKWTLEVDDKDDFPKQMLCYASVVFGKEVEPDTDETVAIAVGNTGTEALSAYLADRLEGSKKIIEDQLEALEFSSRLEHRQLDIGPKFLEARHEKGFIAIPGGSLWTIKPESTKTAAAADASAQTEITLPDQIAHHLNIANGLQQEYDRAWDEIKSLRKQLFSDWYKYMLCAYPPEDARDEYPNIDEVKSYIEMNVASLNDRVVLIGTLGKDKNGKLCAANDGPSLCPLAARVGQAISNLQASLDRHNDAIRLQQRLKALGFDGDGNFGENTKAAVIAFQTSRGLTPDGNVGPTTLAALAQFLPGDELQDAHPSYRLKQISGPRYWRPAEPVVLISGPIVKPSERHGQDGRASDGLLQTQILEGVITKDLPRNKELLTTIRTTIAKMGESPAENFAFSQWTTQPWNPFLLEWEVEVFPVVNKANLDEANRSYSSDFIGDNYTVGENQVDLSFKKDKGTTTKAANIYTGRSILTPHAGIQLKKQIEAFLNKEILPRYYQAKNIQLEQQGTAYLDQNIEVIRKWYEETDSSFKALESKDEDATYTALRAWEELQGLDCLSQSLGGFNEALLMHKQTLQLAISDPLGFDDYQSFAASVRDAVSNSIYSAPEPLNDFNPIRSGGMTVLRLRLVDTFGQVKDLLTYPPRLGQTIDITRVITSELMKSDSQFQVRLAPRLVQPARINFRWLAAESDEQEMNDHPATTPICGWLLTNNLDNRLMIYDNRGKALGSLVMKDTDPSQPTWEPAPGGGPDALIKIDDIRNPHLKKMVANVQMYEADFFTDFITAVDSALENIEPENFAQHQDIALLMGSPIAVVRASLNLELKGLPALQQGWNEFRQDLERDTRDDNAFSEVMFPIRIGEYRQFNDGTVGYWKEKEGGYEGDVFYAPQSNDEVKIKDSHLKTHKTDPMTFSQSVKSEPQILTLLLDPRGLVHATSGILPAKAIRIPPDQYGDALQAIEITFLSTPILTDVGKIHLPLPAEAGYQWSWLQRSRPGEWAELSTSGVINKTAFAVFQGDAEVIWNELIGKGWIEYIDSNDKTRAIIKAKELRKSQSLADNLQVKTARIEDILDRMHIGPIDPGAKFSGPQQIREGWLKLSVDERNANSNQATGD